MSVIAEVPTETSRRNRPWTSFEDVSVSLGDIPYRRIRFSPIPGTATEADCLRVSATDKPCELVDGTLVEKPMGTPEGLLGLDIAFYLKAFVKPRRMGMVVGEGGFFRMYHGNIRLPDASFTKRERLPNPLPQVGGWCPDLCVEVLSPDNTRSEMRTKRKEYFASGCRLMWILDKKSRTCEVFTSEFESVEIGMEGILDGGSVLPGFRLPMKDIFAEHDDYFPPNPS